MDGCDSWSKGGDTLEVLTFEMDSFAAQPIDILSENMLLDDAPLEQDDIPSIPMLRTIPEDMKADDNAEEGEGSVPEARHKIGKAEILTGAVAYISHLEGKVERLGSEVVVLKARVMALKKLAMSGSIVLSNGPSSRALVIETLQTVQAGKLRL
jgi:hypothetical protein